MISNKNNAPHSLELKNKQQMKMKYWTIYILLLITSVSLNAQQDYVTRKTAHKKAIKAYNKANTYNRARDYGNAIKELGKAIKKEPTFLDAYLLRADSYYALQDFSNAEADFEKILSIAPDFNPRINYVVSIVEAQQNKYDEAVTHLQTFLEAKPQGEKITKQAQKRLEDYTFAAKAIKNPVPFDPQNLGENINTPLAEYLPTLTADGQTLIFTRRDRFQEDFYVSQWKDGAWQRAENLGPPINTRENEGAESISADGQFLVYTVCNRKEDYGSCDLYYSEWKNGEWTTPKNIGAPINSAAWESQPSLSADGQTLYFTSNRSKNKDIWKSKRLADGTWSNPEKLSINTAGHEEGPFIHADGQTLYFTSTGYPGMGEADLYMSRLQADGTWGMPENLGYPINTTSQEGALIVSLDGTTAYFSSTKEGGYGAVDLYSFEMPKSIRPKPVTYANIKVYDAITKRPLIANMDVANLETSLIHTSMVTNAAGESLICLPMGVDYALNVNKADYLFHSENFALKAENSRDEPFELKIYLQKIPKQEPTITIKEEPVLKPIILKNVFFKTGSAELELASQSELDKLVGLLNENETMNIQINGHTDNVGSVADNLKLSEARAKAVVEYLITKKIPAKRLKYKGYGETLPIATNDTPDGRQQNRRTEFVIMK